MGYFADEGEKKMFLCIIGTALAAQSIGVLRLNRRQRSDANARSLHFRR
jgi:hypothetical protein